MIDPQCVFCKIAIGDLPGYVVHKDSNSIAFLDNRPLFPGHVLLCPQSHYETLTDVPPDLATNLMIKTQLLTRAVEGALDAEGSFLAVNNRVSQTVPHLHIHIVPRRRRDGLRGFFWPRQNYRDSDAMEAVRDAIEREIQKLLS